MKQYLFSFAAVVVTVGSIAYLTRQPLTEEQMDHEEKLMQENLPPSPKVQEPTTPYIELPDDTIKASPPKPHKAVKRPTVKAIQHKLVAPKIPDMECEKEWHDSVLFSAGGRYRNCKLK